MHDSSDKHASAEEVYAQFLAGRSTAEPLTSAEVEDLCVEHPEIAVELREIAADDRKVADALEHAMGTPDPVSTDTEDSAAERIGPYRILGVLGEGGMGIVHLAEQKEPFRRRVALKVIKAGHSTKEVMTRFAAEQQALAMMEHENIAKVFDAGTTEKNQPYFVMELVRGLPATEYCDKHKLTNRERIEIVRQVCAGVQHAHQKGVIHRDLKPSNVLVTDHEGRAVVKIIDFGVARATDHRLVETTIFTEEGRLIGTPEYMSPEQAGITQADIDTRTDIYSLGVILYEMLVGALPFSSGELRAHGLFEIQRKIRDEDPPKPSTRFSSLGAKGAEIARVRKTTPAAMLRAIRGDLDWIAMMAMDKDRNRRYGSASELSADLLRYLEDDPVLAGPPTAGYRLKKMLRRYRGPFVAVSAVFLTLLVGLGAFAFENKRARESAREADRQRYRVLALSSGRDLEELQRWANDLWPPTPGRLSSERGLRAWMKEADELVATLEAGGAEHYPGHRKMLDELEERTRIETIGTGLSDAGTRAFALQADAWWHDQLSNLIDRIQAFADSDTGLRGTGHAAGFGWGVGKRLKEAERLGAAYSEGAPYSNAWAEALPAIRRRYPELELSPLMGLVPVGEDPGSGLWEFAHVFSGELPEKDDSGHVRIKPETGLVLVLIPATGTFARGASADPGPFHDSLATPLELRGNAVQMRPFLISKFEMTQAQWARMFGNSPSYFRIDVTVPFETETHPVEQVSYELCSRVLTRFSLRLPTESEWEYAARAGTTTAYSTGQDVESLFGFANFLDDSAARAKIGNATWTFFKEYDDGAPVTSPVGSFAPNGFGLHDTAGNVFEWCAKPDDAPDCVIRGGSWNHNPASCRIAFRRLESAQFSRFSAGIRPCFDLQGARQE